MVLGSPCVGAGTQSRWSDWLCDQSGAGFRASAGTHRSPHQSERKLRLGLCARANRRPARGSRNCCRHREAHRHQLTRIEMKREQMRGRVVEHRGPWDMIIVGGGATGIGIAIDAASRGYDVLLLEQSDFGKGTSSRSTKLAHGGVRYLEQGNISLVMEALKERGLMRQNAPHLVHDLAFVVPNYDWWEAPFYGLGLKLYQLLAGKYGFGASRILSREETLQHLPTLKTEGLRGGAIYYDGQFDDARLLIHMVVTASDEG